MYFRDVVYKDILKRLKVKNKFRNNTMQFIAVLFTELSKKQITLH